MLAVLTLTLSLVALGLLALLIHKVVRIHVATFRVVDDLAATRIETEAIFGQVQAYLSLERLLSLAQPLPPLRGWAGSPDFLLHVAQATLSRKPSVVVECSSGASTVVIARSLQLNGRGHVYSLEHETEFANKTRDLIAMHGLQDWATVVDAPLQTRVTATPWYDDSRLPTSLPPIELIVVDGPPQAVAKLARAPAWARLGPRASEHCAVLIDDASRPDETEMVRQWIASDHLLSAHSLPAEKGCVLVQRAARN